MASSRVAGPTREKTGERTWCSPQHDLEAAEDRDVAPLGAADDEAVARAQRLAGRRRGADRVHMLLPEPTPEPGVDERRVRRRDDGVVARRALVDPARGREPVQVADDLGLRDGVP